MVEKLMRKIELANWNDIQRRVYNDKRSLEMIYGVQLDVDVEDIPLERLYPTEDFLENDKLALVFMKVLTEDYNVPIIVVKRETDYFVIDGHHRAYIFKKLQRKAIDSYVVKFPKGKSYRDVAKWELEEMPIKDVGELEDPMLSTWGQMLTVLKYFEALYHVPFYLNQKEIKLNELVPTQSLVKRSQIESIKELRVPIACIRYEGKYYVLDGHARSLRAKQLGFKTIQAIILFPKTQIDYGIVKTVKETNLKEVGDIKITD
jgi:IMP dehydrogenase